MSRPSPALGAGVKRAVGNEGSTRGKPGQANNVAMGRRLRELREARGLQQGEMARRLSISPAYLSLIEQGKRAMQLPLLFAALELYGEPTERFMASLVPAPDPREARLREAPALRTLGLTESDLALIAKTPTAADALSKLASLYDATRERLDALLTELGEGERESRAGTAHFDYQSYDAVGRFLEQNKNYFPTLEECAERFRRKAELSERLPSRELELALTKHLGVTVRNSDTGDSVMQRWDPEKRTLTLSPHLREHRRRFRLAHSIALRLFEEDDPRTLLLEDLAQNEAPETLKLIKIHMSNYVAGAILLPYQQFYDAVVETRYDVELLESWFDTSFESVAHRLCNLGDPKRPGVPLHFLRVDIAGNISKRYAGDGIAFPSREGGCPKMTAHLAFLSPNIITKQYAVFPDGSTHFTFAKVTSEREGGSIARGTLYSIGLGCRAEDASRLAYADDMPFADPKRMTVPVGTTCRSCERTDCRMRSAPSYAHQFRVDETITKANFFSPGSRKPAES